MGDIIDASNFFKARAAINARDIESAKEYIGAESYSKDLTLAIVENIVSIMDETGFDINDTETVERIAMVSIIIGCIFDSQLGVENLFKDYLDGMITGLKELD